MEKTKFIKTHDFGQFCYFEFQRVKKICINYAFEKISRKEEMNK